MLSPKRRLFKGDTVNLILGLVDYIYSAVRHPSFKFSLLVHRDCFSIVPFQYQILHDFEMDCLGGAVIQRYSSDFARRLEMAYHGIHYPIGIVFRSTTKEFFKVNPPVLFLTSQLPESLPLQPVWALR